MSIGLSNLLLVLAGVGGVVTTLYYGTRLLQLRAEGGPVTAYLDSLGLGGALYADRTMITVNARLRNPRPVAAIVQDITLWHSDGGWVLQTLVDHEYGYTTERRAIEVPPKQTLTLQLGHAIRSVELERRGSPRTDYTLRVTLSDGTSVDAARYTTDFI